MLTRIVRKARHKVRALVMRGHTYRCPLCDKTYSQFIGGLVCPGCGAHERHRMLWLYLLHLERNGRIAFNGKLLHVAPETCLAAKLKRTFAYLSIDRDEGRAMQAADITNLPFANDSFDAIVCNHVLEHLNDDHRAMSELQRVLKPGGWASLLVPIRETALTDEDPAVIDPQERLHRFGQEDHVRLYGYDYLQRLQLAGFSVEAASASDYLTPEITETCCALNELMIFGWKAPSQVVAETENLFPPNGTRDAADAGLRPATDAGAS